MVIKASIVILVGRGHAHDTAGGQRCWTSLAAGELDVGSQNTCRFLIPSNNAFRNLSGENVRNVKIG